MKISKTAWTTIRRGIPGWSPRVKPRQLLLARTQRGPRVRLCNIRRGTVFEAYNRPFIRTGFRAVSCGGCYDIRYRAIEYLSDFAHPTVPAVYVL